MKKLLVIIAITIVAGCNMPQNAIIPVQNATSKDWHQYSYWHYPWGKSGVHKGIDIFAPKGRPVVSAVYGIVLFSGRIDMGGNVVAVLGPKWRIHYYAHLAAINTSPLSWASRGEVIGTVGDTGNAAGKPPHLHYSVLSLIPNPANITTETQGWKRMFFVNPADGFVI